MTSDRSFRTFIPLALGIASLLGAGPASAVFLLHDQQNQPQQVDYRSGEKRPAADQLKLISALKADAVWNRFGTVHSLVRHGGYLSSGYEGTPAEAARAWVRDHRQLFRLSPQGVDELELVNEAITPHSEARAVLFRQRFGGLPSAAEGLITVGVVNGKIYYVSSSSVGDQPPPSAVRLSPEQAWLRAAENVNFRMPLSAVLSVTDTLRGRGWQEMRVRGLDWPQRARLGAMALPEGGLRQVYETIVLDNRNGIPTAYTHFIDAENGAVLRRENKVFNQAGGTPQTFTGSLVDGGACAARHDFEVSEGNGSVSVLATAAMPVNDIVINLYFQAANGSTQLVASGDLLTSPELLSYSPTGGVAPGTYQVEICPFDPTVAALPPANYFGVFTAGEGGAVTAGGIPILDANPKWVLNSLSPSLDYSDEDVRLKGCWNKEEGCDYSFANTAARMQWDVLLGVVPTLTTIGNAAITAGSAISPLSPSVPHLPLAPTRDYDFPFNNAWFNSSCSLVNAVGTLLPAGNVNDIDASVVNLFASHNRMHNWAYYLGFTELNYNMQLNNFGLTSVVRGNDPEIGSAQAGAITGGFPLYLGRNNANQIALNDGIPGITNQYLFQPLGGALYAPCADGGFDMSIIGHEYGHAISNRMIGGPDAGISGAQGGAMGEGWSDLLAAEHLAEYDFLPFDQPGNPTALARYVTGNIDSGLRNYSGDGGGPLNYSNIGYDTPGVQVHADSEIWVLTNWQIRQALVEKYQSAFPVEDKKRQKECADGLYGAEACAGNRRWMQIMFDSFLLMPAAPSMLDARDAMLAADVARFGGANQTEMWKAFAERGMGAAAYSNGSDDPTPIPDFSSPLLTTHAQVKFEVYGADGRTALGGARVYVGQFATRSRPIADTDATTVVNETDALSRQQTSNLDDTANFVPGRFDFMVAAPGYGMHRFAAIDLSAGTQTLRFSLPENMAALGRGAVALTSAADAANIALKDMLIDETEDTGAVLGDAGLVAGAHLTVQLAGGAQSVSRVHLSTAAGPNNPGRFNGIRAFEIRTCEGSCTDPVADFQTIAYTSTADAFPGQKPRPTQPQLNLRSFEFPAVRASHVQLRVLSSQCTGNTDFHGELDTDPLNATDCITSTAGETVRATDFQVFSAAAKVEKSGATGEPLPGTPDVGGALGLALLLPGLFWGLRRRNTR
ncbi:MAG: M36 family metallopeptidase [Stagnimonas sp.]|nr:M36 family metallopeptidase [Stagnimonas sp.]